MIRKAEIKDLEQIQTFLNHFSTSVSHTDYIFYMVYEFNDKIVGVLEYSILYERSEINYIYVDDNMRRKNIATQLIEAMISDCYEKNVENITLEVNEQNTKAIGLYQKMEFQEVARRKHYYGDKDAILMERRVM